MPDRIFASWRKPPPPPPPTPAATAGEKLILASLETIVRALTTLNQRMDTIMASVADVQAALASTESKEETIIGLLQTEQELQRETLAQLKALQASGATDPAALDAIVTKLNADAATMDAAIASVTPPSPAGA